MTHLPRALLPLLLLPSLAMAQSPQADALPRTNQIDHPRADRTQLQTPPKPAPQTNQIRVAARPLARYSGILPSLKQGKSPLHLVNPFTPSPRPAFLENISVDPSTHQAAGIALFRIRF